MFKHYSKYFLWDEINEIQNCFRPMQNAFFYVLTFLIWNNIYLLPIFLQEAGIFVAGGIVRDVLRLILGILLLMMVINFVKLVRLPLVLYLAFKIKCTREFSIRNPKFIELVEIKVDAEGNLLPPEDTVIDN